MVAGCRRFLDDRLAFRLEARQQDRALYLRARHFSLVTDAFERTAVDGQRRPLVERLDAGAHQLERDHDPAHGAPAQRVVSLKGGGKRMRGEDAREQPHGRARVLGVQWGSRLHQSSQSSPGDLHGQATVRRLAAADLDAGVLETLKRGSAVGPQRVLVNRRTARRQGAKQRVTMGNGFVAGEPDRAPDAPGRPHRRSGD